MLFISVSSPILKLVCYTVSVSSVSCLMCLNCYLVSLPTSCHEVVTCGPHQICQTEGFVSSTGQLLYNLGCRDRLRCSSSAVLGRRSWLNLENFSPTIEYGSKKHTTALVRETVKRSAITDLTFCNECCDSGDLCNVKGCNQPGFRTDGGPVCYACVVESEPDTCNTVRQCQAYEVCSLEIHQSVYGDLYTTACKSKQECSQLSFGCPGCCDSDLCNTCNVSSVLAATKSTLATSPSTTTSPCRSGVCVHGVCSVVSGHAHCTCSTGYTGVHCETEINHCFSNPCVYGSCVNTASSFVCDCLLGYTGRVCETNNNQDPCYNSACVHGTCNAGSGHVTCTCDAGYQGELCDKTINSLGYSEWTPWTSCSATCGTGTHIRFRICLKADQHSCTASATDVKPCYTNACVK